MIRPDVLVQKSLLVANLAILAFTGAGSAHSQKAETNPVLPGETCSIDPDCKNVARPYCNTVYDLDKGNYGVCSMFDEPEPIHVLGEEDCPPGTRRQLIYKNEGDEAVCLRK